MKIPTNSFGRVFSIAVLFFSVVVCVFPLAAQFTTASIAGTGTDATGAVVPDATVTINNVDTGLTVTVSTEPTGAYLFSRLPIGNYELTVEKAGFSTYVQAGITLTVNQAASQNVALQVGQVTEQVTVEAEAELIVTRTATTGQLVDQKRIVELPLNGKKAGEVDVSFGGNRGSGAQQLPDMRPRRRLPGRGDCGCEWRRHGSGELPTRWRRSQRTPISIPVCRFRIPTRCKNSIFNPATSRPNTAMPPGASSTS